MNETKIFIAVLFRLSTNSSAMFRFPKEWGEFVLADSNDQVRACELIMNETGGTWVPVAYGEAYCEAQLEQFRDSVLEKMGDIPACDVEQKWE
jgi:hypothetical protein